MPHNILLLISRHGFSLIFLDVPGDLHYLPSFVFPQLPAFTAGIVLLLNIWGAKRSGGVSEPAKEMEDVHKCMAVLRAAEGRYVCCNIPHGMFFSQLRCDSLFLRWHAAGRLWCVTDDDICLFLVLMEPKYTGMFFMS